MPLVSVLIRTRDRTALLLDAVRSVLAQDYHPLEIIIVNDGGADASSAIDACIGSVLTWRWLNNEGHGRSAAANTALLHAGGDYCLFLDDDDWLDVPHISGLMAALLQNSTALAAYSSVRTVHDDGSVNDNAFNHDYDALRLRIENYIPIHAVLFARRLFNDGCRFDVSLDRFEDWDFWLQVARHTDFLHVPVCTANYRIAAQSGFGAKTEDELHHLRAAFYRKWQQHWSNTELLALLDRSREFPRIASLQDEKASLLQYVQALKKAELHLVNELTINRQELVLTIEALNELQQLHQRLQHDYSVEREVSAALRYDLDLVYNSTSWRLTRPLRFLNRVRYIWKLEGTFGLIKRVIRKWLRKRPQFPVISGGGKLLPIGPLQFAEYEHPLVSIVVPVYNKIEFTFHCLASVRRNSGSLPYEVIVVDDCSKDETSPVLARISGLRVIRNKKNSGFIESCNAGAEAARGEFLVMLNNDTEPQPGWLDALVATFREKADAGMVGAKLLFGDGSLQEAGGIVWKDGSAWNLGRGEDPNKPEYSYLRAVDYCSGACLMLPRADYFSLGKFDRLFLPAYYEDTDLAFKVRKAGKQMYFQPLARVLHFEGVTNGTDTSGGIKAYQVANQRKFFERWQSVLQAHRENGQMPQLEKERSVQKRVLVVDACVLTPDRDSGSLRMFNLLKILQNLGYKVSFIADNLIYDARYTQQLQAIGIECWYYPYVDNVEQHLQQHGRLYSAVILSRADIAEKNIDAVLRYAPDARIVFDTVDLHFLRERRQAELSGREADMESAEMRRLQELNIARKAHTTVLVSPFEVELFRQEAPGVNVALVSNIHTVHGRGKAWAERSDIVFIGSFEHPPNIDAMHYFIDEIFPLLQQQRPGIKLLVVGSNPPRTLLAKGGDSISFMGFVEDIDPVFDNVRLSIAPLRYGAGVKGKINSSMSYGVPVVATPVAAEGMGLEHYVDVLIAGTPTDFATSIVQAYDDEALWTRLSDGALANLERHFSFAVATEQLRAILK